MRKILGFIFGIFSIISTMHAADFPFTDVKPTDSYYNAVKKLYEGGVIINNGDNLFRPNELMNRDFYVSLTVGVGCKKCSIPDPSDIIRYQFSPFIDLPKTNPYYYCIAYAKEAGITQGYTLNNEGISSCEDKLAYMSSPFCAANNITRIEAAAILLRRANLWDDTINTSNFDRSYPIPDASTYWYGYAKKGIDIKIITPKSDGKIGQDEKITRGEFVIMAEKILKYTQCELDSSLDNTMEGAIGIVDQNGSPLAKSAFEPGENFTLIPITSPGDWNYTWHAFNPITGEVITGDGDSLAGSQFGEGSWKVTLSIIDPSSGKIVSQPTMTLQIGDEIGNYNGNIVIRDKTNAVRNDNVFTEDDAINLMNEQDGTPGDSRWRAVEKNTGKIVTGDQSTLPGNLLSIGEWDITLTTLDKDSGAIKDIDTRKIFIVENGDNGGGNIVIRDKTNAVRNDNIFTEDDAINLMNEQDGTPGDSRWRAVEKNTGKIVTGDQSTLPGNLLSIGEWDITLTTLDKDSGAIKDIDTRKIFIVENGTSDSNLSVLIGAKPLVTYIEGRIDFTSLVTGGSKENTYVWDFGDGTKSTESINTMHAYSNPGVYTVTLIVTDPTTGKTSESTLIVRITGEKDTDKDGVLDSSDDCPQIIGKSENNGCPSIVTTDYRQIIDNLLGDISDIDGDTDGDKVVDQKDACSTVKGAIENSGCPPGTDDDIDGDLVPDSSDKCVNIPGTISGKGCPETSVLDDIKVNACIQSKLRKSGLIYGSVVCSTCPCERSIDLLASLRECDVVFPAILSPDAKDIYSRGGFFMIQ